MSALLYVYAQGLGVRAPLPRLITQSYEQPVVLPQELQT